MAECKNFRAAEGATGEPAPETSDTVRMPWTGRAMGERDIAFLAAMSKPTVVSLMGPHDAGKTTLLGALFLAIHEGMSPSEGLRFAGSYSLSGWHDISARMRLDAQGVVRFPPHTPDREARIPGLLHLRYALDRKIRNLLFADAPGEWYSRWAREPAAEGSKGADWVARTARRHLLIADSGALAGQTRFKAVEQFERISGRLADVTKSTNVALLWTKADIPVPEDMAQRVEASFRRRFPNSPVFSTRVPLENNEIVNLNPQSLRTILDWLLATPLTKPLPAPRRVVGTDPFLSLGAGT